MSSDLTRKQIAEALPDDVTFTLRKVDFTDLARDYAYSLKVFRGGEPMPSMFINKEHMREWSDVLDVLPLLKDYTYKGKRILV